MLKILSSDSTIASGRPSYYAVGNFVETRCAVFGSVNGGLSSLTKNEMLYDLFCPVEILFLLGSGLTCALITACCFAASAVAFKIDLFSLVKSLM